MTEKNNLKSSPAVVKSKFSFMQTKRSNYSQKKMYFVVVLVAFNILLLLILISRENCSAQPKIDCDCLHVECKIKQIERPTFTFGFVTSIILTPLIR